MEIFRNFINDGEDMVKKISVFSMKIPGFKNLFGDDRINLVKRRCPFSVFLQSSEIETPRQVVVLINKVSGRSRISCRGHQPR